MKFRLGLDVFLTDVAPRLRGKSVACLSHMASVTSSGEHIIFALRRCGLNLSRLFSPEHGLWGVAQDMEGVGDCFDPVVEQEVISLYGHSLETLEPNNAHLDELDAIVIDLQDVGSRYYTYVYTAWFLSRAALMRGLEVYVLDRPNPIADAQEGNIVEEKYKSFVGAMPIATRHAMTIGELISMWAKDEDLYRDNLHVIQMQGWNHRLYFDETQLPWVSPSPNMPSLDTAIIYPGLCLLEGTNLSEGRGTCRPFEFFGAPWFLAKEAADALESLNLPAVRFSPVAFRPMFQKHANTLCQGLHIQVIARNEFLPLLTGIAILSVAWALHPEKFRWRTETYEFVSDRLAIDLLFGNDRIRPQIEAQKNPYKIIEEMNHESVAFRKKREAHLLYL